jgi:DNA-binding NarL/FixJ family response regulator
VIRVLLVDDQALVRAGLRRILRARDGFSIAGECDNGAAALDAVAAEACDVVVMDVRMPVMDGVTATRALRSREGAPPVLVLTTFDDDEALAGALRAGASGFLLKDAPAEDIIRAVRSVAEGGAWLDAAVTQRVLATYRSNSASPAATVPAAARVAEITERELEVLRLIGRGASNPEIAAALHIGEGTVKTHVGHIFDKLELRDRAAAIVFAFDNGLVVPGG